MPYIPRELRPDLEPMECSVAQDEGQLNYQISCLLNEYMLEHGLSYARCGDCVAACENAKHEFQRRIQDPYEDEKIRLNGDVYDKSLTGLSSWLPESISFVPRSEG